MKKQIKAIKYSLLIAFALTFTIICNNRANAAAKEFTDGIFTFTVSDENAKTVTVTACHPDAAAEKVEIPGQVDYQNQTYTVTSVTGRPEVFYHDDEATHPYKVKTLMLPSTITGNVTGIDWYLPDLEAVVFTGNTAPAKFELRSVDVIIYVPKGSVEAYQKVTKASYEYSRSDLYEATFDLVPNIVEAREENVEANDFWKDGFLYQVIEKAGSGTGKVKLLGNYNKSSFVMLPDTVTNGIYTYQLTQLGSISLCGSRAKYFVIPDTVTKMDSYVFDNDATHIFLSKNCTTIPTHLIAGGENGDISLKYLYIPEGVKEISANAFSKASFNNLNSMIIPSSVQTIGQDAFASIKTIVFMNSKPVKNLVKALSSDKKAYANSYAKSKIIKTSANSKKAYQKALHGYAYKVTYKTKKTVVKASSLKVSKTSVSLGKGKKSVIKAALSSKKANETVQWSSTDNAIAKVSANGTIAAVKKGTAYVIAYTQTTGLYQMIKVMVK